MANNEIAAREPTSAAIRRGKPRTPAQRLRAAAQFTVGRVRSSNDECGADDSNDRNLHERRLREESPNSAGGGGRIEICDPGLAATDEREQPCPEYRLARGSSAHRKLTNGSLRLPAFAEIDAKIRSGEWQFHQFPNGFIVSEIRKYSDSDVVLLVHLIFGERLQAWKDEANTFLTIFARQHGCTSMEALCRRGMEAVLKPSGWKRTRVLLRKDI